MIRINSLKHWVPSPVRAPINKIIKQSRFQIRYATAQFRALPHFIIIGAMKSGTTSMFSYLAQHPQILKSSIREVHFFDRNFQKGIKWYQAHFPFSKRVITGSITGEATPQYIFHPSVPERIYQHIPKVKLIVLLRNPTERAISHYFMAVRKKREHLHIMQAFKKEEARLEKVLRRNDFTNPVFAHFSYKKRGIYKEQLKRYMRYFSARQMFITNSESFFQNPRKIMREVFYFLKVDEKFEVSDIEPRNVGVNRTTVNQEVYDYLNEYFSSHNRALYDLVGTNYSWS